MFSIFSEFINGGKNMCLPCVIVVYNCTMHQAAACISVISFIYVFLFVLKPFVCFLICRTEHSSYVLKGKIKRRLSHPDHFASIRFL